MKKNHSNLLLILFFLTLSPNRLIATVYTTVAAGNWTSTATWQNGIVPGHTIAAADVVNINHSVIYNRPNDLVVYGRINITNTLLQFPTSGNGSGRTVTVYAGGIFSVTNSTFVMPIQDGSGNDLSGNFILDGGRLIANESQMDIAQNWESKSGATANLQNTCMRIGQSHLLTSGTIDTCINLNIEVGIHGSGNFELSGNSIVRIGESKLLITGSGNFKVNGGSTFTSISGYPIGLYGLKVTGSLDNDGTWSAVVQDHCLDGSIGGSNTGQITSNLANPENCTYVNSMADLLCSFAAPLPIHLESFQGNLDKNNKTTLLWTVSNNELIKHFEIQRSFNGRDFFTVALVPASEKTGVEKYIYHEMINANDKVMYRLKIFNKQTQVDYSRILVLQPKAAIDNDVKIIGNPTTDKLTLHYASSQSKIITVKLYDVNGKLLMSTNANILEGDNIISLKLNSTISAGMYVAELNNGEVRHTLKFIKQ